MVLPFYRMIQEAVWIVHGEHRCQQALALLRLQLGRFLQELIGVFTGVEGCVVRKLGLGLLCEVPARSMTTCVREVCALATAAR